MLALFVQTNRIAATVQQRPFSARLVSTVTETYRANHALIVLLVVVFLLQVIRPGNRRLSAQARVPLDTFARVDHSSRFARRDTIAPVAQARQVFARSEHIQSTAWFALLCLLYGNVEC